MYLLVKLSMVKLKTMLNESVALNRAYTVPALVRYALKKYNLLKYL